MKAWLTVLALASLCCGVSACDDNAGSAAGGSDASPADMPAAEVTLDDICNPGTGTFVALRAKYTECFPEIGLQLGTTPSAEQLSALCQGSFQPILQDGSLKLGTTADLQACRTYLDSLTCESLTSADAPNPCQALLVGMLPEDSACDQSAQCSGASYCARALDATCGQCAAKLADGAECGGNEQCQSGYCAGLGPNPVGTCRVFADVGEACTRDIDCKGTLICASSVCAAEPEWQADTPCNPFEPRQCNPYKTGLYCGAGNTCQPFAQVGDTCGLTAPCNPFEYEFCKTGPNNTSQCAEATIVNEGDVCDSPGLKCADGLLCGSSDPATPPRCFAPRDKDESCSQAGELCGPLLVCSQDSSCQYGWYTGECSAQQ